MRVLTTHLPAPANLRRLRDDDVGETFPMVALAQLKNMYLEYLVGQQARLRNNKHDPDETKEIKSIIDDVDTKVHRLQMIIHLMSTERKDKTKRSKTDVAKALKLYQEWYSDYPEVRMYL